MLSRVAERLYWLGRYVERAENTSRLVSVVNNVTLDMPGAAGVLWPSVLELLGSSAAFRQRHALVNEKNVLRWLIADESQPGSLVSSLQAARENARTVREVLPSEAWELLNALYWSAHETAEASTGRKHREAWLDNVVLKSHQFAGLISGTMSHREPYQFLLLGATLERADMTSRIIDVGASLARRGAEFAADEGLLWMNILLCLSAYQMYRQQIRERVTGAEVVEFLMCDPGFPHAVRWCLDHLEQALGNLPNNQAPLRANRRMVKLLAGAELAALLQDGLHEFIDALQIELAALHADIARAWFGHTA